MYAQVDTEGYVHNMMEAILYYKRGVSVVDKEDIYIKTKSGQRPIQKTTLVWKLLVKCKNGTEQWIPLKYLKESNFLELAELSSERGIDGELTFVWWVP